MAVRMAICYVDKYCKNLSDRIPVLFYATVQSKAGLYQIVLDVISHVMFHHASFVRQFT